MFDIHSIPGEVSSSVDWAKLQHDFSKDNGEREVRLLPESRQHPLEVTEADLDKEQIQNLTELEEAMSGIRNR